MKNVVMPKSVRESCHYSIEITDAELDLLWEMSDEELKATSESSEAEWQAWYKNKEGHEPKRLSGPCYNIQCFREGFGPAPIPVFPLEWIAESGLVKGSVHAGYDMFDAVWMTPADFRAELDSLRAWIDEKDPPKDPQE